MYREVSEKFGRRIFEIYERMSAYICTQMHFTDMLLVTPDAK